MQQKVAQMVILFSLCSAGTTWATFPLTVDEADTQDPYTVQLETGTEYGRDSQCHHFDFPIALTYGVMPRWDIAAGFGGQFEQRTRHRRNGIKKHVSGFSDLDLATKWMFLTESTYLPRQSLCPSVTLPTAKDEEGLGSGQTDYDLTWLLSKSLGDRANIHLNLGYSWLGETPDEDWGNLIHYGVAADYELFDSFQVIGEVFGEHEFKEDDSALQVNVGFRWEVLESLQLVAAAGTRLMGETSDLTATIGLIWVWDFHQQEKE